MDKDIFDLDDSRLADIAAALCGRINEGLARDGAEILALPTCVTPRPEGVKGRALALDLGGTNYRAAVVDLGGPEPVISPAGGIKKELPAMKTRGFTGESLLDEMVAPVAAMKPRGAMPVGYCFSYPVEALPDGDGKLVRWTKGVNIPSMIGRPVGRPLLDRLNAAGAGMFTGIKVVNDTVASLFAGLTRPGYDAYIGLIVGTGTNMAAFFAADAIPKLLGEDLGGMVPVNLESGNFVPPGLTAYDDAMDAASDNPGRSRFEKAVSGFYLGRILQALYPETDFGGRFDAAALTAMIDDPAGHDPAHVASARVIYRRSAALVAASVAGLVMALRQRDPLPRRVMLTAEGGLFWSRAGDEEYRVLVETRLNALLARPGMGGVTVDIARIENANLVGTAIAALS